MTTLPAHARNAGLTLQPCLGPVATAVTATHTTTAESNLVVPQRLPEPARHPLLRAPHMPPLASNALPVFAAPMPRCVQQALIRLPMQVARLLGEYYALDREDTAGGVATRFRYARVPPIHDGLDVAEILMLPDMELNSIMGMGKLAAYHEGTERLRPNYKALGAARQELHASEAWADTPGRKRAARAVAKPRSGARKRAVDSATAAVLEDAKQTAAATPGIGEKRKRPGPALRRAQKAAAKAGAQSQQNNSTSAAAATQGHTARQEGTPGNAGAQKHTPGPLAASAEELKQRRLASYGKLALPSSARGKEAQAGSSGPTGKHKQKAGVSQAGGRLPDVESAEQPVSQVPAGLPKAARKNMKRALKRQAQRQAED